MSPIAIMFSSGLQFRKPSTSSSSPAASLRTSISFSVDCPGVPDFEWGLASNNKPRAKLDRSRPDARVTRSLQHLLLKSLTATVVCCLIGRQLSIHGGVAEFPTGQIGNGDSVRLDEVSQPIDPMCWTLRFD